MTLRHGVGEASTFVLRLQSPASAHRDIVQQVVCTNVQYEKVGGVQSAAALVDSDVRRALECDQRNGDNMKKLLKISSLLGALALAGCSGEVPSSDAGAELGEEQAELIQIVDVGREQLKFLDMKNGGSIVISSTKPDEIPRFTVDVLEESAGTQLTALEVFRAVAPEGIEPDDRLLEDHLKHASALGRADTAPLEVAFDVQEEQLVDKFTPQQCHSLLFGNAIIVISRDNQTFLDICTANRPMIPQGSCNHWIQTNRHRAGFCNNATTGSQFGIATITSDGAGSASTSASVPPNTAQLWTGTPAFNDDLTGFRRSKMRLTTRNNFGTFHARLTDY